MNYKLSPSDLIFSYNKLRAILVVVIAMLMALIVAGCSATTPSSLVDIETIDKGEYSGIETKEQIVIESHNSWETFWANHMAVHTPTPSLPEVDFSHEMVIAVFSGWKPTGGYSVEISEIELVNDAVNVYYREISPEPGQLVTEAETQPFHIVKIGKIDNSSVKFIEKQED